MEMTPSILSPGDVKSGQNSALYVQFECIANVCDVSTEESCNPVWYKQKKRKCQPHL